MALVTIQEAAVLLRVSPVTIRRHVAAGRLPAVRVGRQIRIERDALDDFAAPVSAQPSRASTDGVLTADSPFWELFGIMGEGPDDLSTNHDAYLADAYAETHDR
jgi:excisionase family DNA binding protein